MKTWKFWMQPRNSKSAPVEEILVQGKDINEATSKAVSKRPGHIWLQHEEILTEDLTPEELNADDDADDADWKQEETKGQRIPMWNVTMYRSGYEDMIIKLGGKDKQQVQHKALSIYPSWNIVRAEKVKFDEPNDFGENPGVLLLLQEQANKRLDGYPSEVFSILREFMTRAFNAGYQTSQQDIAAREARTAAKSEEQPWYPSEGMAYAQTDLDADEGPQAPDPWREELDRQIDRLHDTLRLIEQTTELQQPFGSDLANFRRRILLLVRA